MQKSLVTNEGELNPDFLTIFPTHSYHKYGTLFTKSTHSFTPANTKSSYEPYITKV
jgi:hypothetical protein